MIALPGESDDENGVPAASSGVLPSGVLPSGVTARGVTVDVDDVSASAERGEAISGGGWCSGSG